MLTSTVAGILWSQLQLTGNDTKIYISFFKFVQVVSKIRHSVTTQACASNGVKISIFIRKNYRNDVELAQCLIKLQRHGSLCETKETLYIMWNSQTVNNTNTKAHTYIRQYVEMIVRYKMIHDMLILTIWEYLSINLSLIKSPQLVM